MNSPDIATHPTLGLGAKSSGEAGCELTGEATAATRRTATWTQVRANSLDRTVRMATSQSVSSTFLAVLVVAPAARAVASIPAPAPAAASGLIGLLLAIE